MNTIPITNLPNPLVTSNAHDYIDQFSSVF